MSINTCSQATIDTANTLDELIVYLMDAEYDPDFIAGIINGLKYGDPRHIRGIHDYGVDSSTIEQIIQKAISIYHNSSNLPISTVLSLTVVGRLADLLIEKMHNNPLFISRQDHAHLSTTGYNG